MTTYSPKPGDVAMAHWDAKEVRGFIDADGRFYTTDQRAKGIAANHPAFQPKNLRPLVVIDPNDREQVKRLADAYYRARGLGEPAVCQSNYDNMQAALRSLLTPPKPDEPTTWGSVVEDDQGNQWVLIANGWWSCAQDEDGDAFLWDEVRAVKVVREGVTP